eukprot:CAMPEP_0198122662 /NCGR_PEP_ID=MMETSP1442-20131203/35488_1 /TAXON_ID= /ORGANISM="Craspedostauros australis, Strain CCMP3328" /LENGTH=171 /DNA_ID=CAMNT_0043781737 /DNA_START=155 /DNA_END=670 /DNA_ORIENTATION=-
MPACRRNATDAHVDANDERPNHVDGGARIAVAEEVGVGADVPEPPMLRSVCSVLLGASVGGFEGLSDGADDASDVGELLGAEVGWWEGVGDGSLLGIDVGTAVGITDGARDGIVVGVDEGAPLGVDDGESLGDDDTKGDSRLQNSISPINALLELEKNGCASSVASSLEAP